MKNKYFEFANFSIPLIVLLTLLASSAQAKLVTEIIKVPVAITNLYSKTTEHQVTVTLLHDDACVKDSTKPYPIAIINHGRATNITNAR